MSGVDLAKKETSSLIFAPFLFGVTQVCAGGVIGGMVNLSSPAWFFRSPPLIVENQIMFKMALVMSLAYSILTTKTISTLTEFSQLEHLAILLLISFGYFLADAKQNALQPEKTKRKRQAIKEGKNVTLGNRCLESKKYR